MLAFVHERSSLIVAPANKEPALRKALGQNVKSFAYRRHSILLLTVKPAILKGEGDVSNVSLFIPFLPFYSIPLRTSTSFTKLIVCATGLDP